MVYGLIKTYTQSDAPMLSLQICVDCAPLLYPLDKLVEDGYAKRQ